MRRRQKKSDIGQWKKITCPKCGLTNIGRQDNCLVCHAQLSPAEKQNKHINTTSCNKCGAEVKNGQKFCLQCGLKVEEPRKITTCPSCGIETTGKQKFCLQCGKNLKT